MGTVISAALALAFVLVGGVLALAAHEGGHALGGKLGGLRFAMLVVGPVRAHRAADGRLRWGLNASLGAAGGIASSVPARPDGLRRAYLLFAAGGPAASLAVGALALGAYAALGLADVSRRAEPVLAAAAAGLFAFAATSLCVGVGTLVPLRVGGLVHDGARVLALRRPGPAAEREAAGMALAGYFIAGRRPRDWDPAVVAAAVSVPDGSYADALARYLAYFHALDREDTPAAEAHVRYLVERADGVQAAFRPVIAAEAAYFDAAYRDAAASARARLDAAGTSPLLDAQTRLRAEAAVLLAEGRSAEAAERIRRLHDDLAAHDGIAGAAFLMAEARRLCRRAGLPDPARDAPPAPA